MTRQLPQATDPAAKAAVTTIEDESLYLGALPTLGGPADHIEACSVENISGSARHGSSKLAQFVRFNWFKIVGGSLVIAQNGLSHCGSYQGE